MNVDVIEEVLKKVRTMKKHFELYKLTIHEGTRESALETYQAIIDTLEEMKEK